MRLGLATAGAAVVVAFSFTPAVAKSRGYVECLERAQAVTVMVRNCQVAEEERQSKVLDPLYKTLLRRLHKPFKADLRKSQRAWLAYRDVQCDFEMDPGAWGSIAPILAGDCWIALTDERIERLRIVLRGVSIGKS